MDAKGKKVKLSIWVSIVIFRESRVALNGCCRTQQVKNASARSRPPTTVAHKGLSSVNLCAARLVAIHANYH